ncbi:MAG: cytochrome c3 family protein [Bryobacterales bacterium]|jgi:hypothetical protein|nr:cytochrome c3 family protein [Bryobacterales bacterium]
MAQVFHYSTNTLARASVVIALVLVGGGLWILLAIGRTSYITQQEVVREQPVPFSHSHHVGGLGIDCRYCHTSVENAAFANVPPTKTCMNCHSQIWTGAPMLEPVRSSFRTGESLEWTRVHDLPDYVYFNHSIHLKKGVGCETCHGRVDQMPLMFQQNSLLMEWCLDCHRNPQQYVRPREELFTMGYKPPNGNQAALGEKLVADYKIQSLTSCSVCHR